MTVLFTRGDLFATPDLHAFAHSCDCAGGMSAGVAAQFKQRWPRMFEEYVARCADGRFTLGDVFVWTEGETTVFNLGTQANWKEKARIPALVKALRRTVELAEKAGIERVGLPRIGSGLGGLDWTRVKKVLEEVAGTAKVTLVVYEQFVRAKTPAPTA